MKTLFNATNRRLTLGRRFALGFSVLLALMLALAGTSQALMGEMSRQMRGIVEVNNQKLALATSMSGETAEIAVSLRTLILLTDLREVDKQLLALDRASERASAVEAALKKTLAEDGADPRESALLQRISQVHATVMPLVHQAARLGADGSTPEAGAMLMKDIRPVEEHWRTLIASLADLEQRLNGGAYEQARSTQHMATGVLVGVTLFAMAAGTLLSWVLTRSVLLPVTQAIRVAERVSEGDLGTLIETDRVDELGRLLVAVRTMQHRLRALVGEIRHSADSISVATAEIAFGNNDLSRRTEGQAASLQKTASSMEQLTGAVRSNAEAIRRADALSSAAACTAAQGGQVISQVRTKMTEISAHSRRIADIIGVIDNIAFRTNILALNAAVEASRAGDAGRGFAVVAAEVRNLAKGSAEAARQIRALILDSSAGVKSGEGLVGEASATMSAIVDSIAKVTVIMSEIAEATREQSGGIAQVGGEVAQLDGMTQQNAALVEQSAAATESLRGQAERLMGSVGVFRMGEEQEQQGAHDP